MQDMSAHRHNHQKATTSKLHSLFQSEYSGDHPLVSPNKFPKFCHSPSVCWGTSTQSPGFHRSQPLALGWRWKHLGGHVFVELDGVFHNLSAWCADLMWLSMLICLPVNKQDMCIYICVCTYNMRNYMVM